MSEIEDRITQLTETIERLETALREHISGQEKRELDVLRQSTELNTQLQNNFREVAGTLAALVSYVKEPNIIHEAPETIEEKSANVANLASHRVGSDGAPPAKVLKDTKAKYFTRMWVTDEEFRTRYASLFKGLPEPKKGARRRVLNEEETLTAHATEAYKHLKEFPLLADAYNTEHTTYKSGF